jgi:hypothetical protein
MLVIELFELAEGMEQVALVPDQGPVQQLTATGCTYRSMTVFILGIRTPVSATSIPASARTA